MKQKNNLIKLLVGLFLGASIAAAISYFKIIDKENDNKTNLFKQEKELLIKLKVESALLKSNLKPNMQKLNSILGAGYSIQAIDSLASSPEYIIQPLYNEKCLFILEKNQCNLFIR